MLDYANENIRYIGYSILAGLVIEARGDIRPYIYLLVIIYLAIRDR